jgi:hypothetical protein
MKTMIEIKNVTPYNGKNKNKKAKNDLKLTKI